MFKSMVRTRARKFLMIAVVASLVVVAAIGQSFLRMQGEIRDGQPSGVISERAQVVAVTFSSKWCGPCKILKPRLAAVKPDFAGKPVRFIELSFTFGEPDTYRALAEAEGFATAYRQYHKATGFTVLINRDSGKVIDILTMDFTKDAMRAAITQALADAA